MMISDLLFMIPALLAFLRSGPPALAFALARQG